MWNSALLDEWINHQVSDIYHCIFDTDSQRNENVPNESNHLPLKAYVDKVKETAEYYSIPVLDLYATGGIYPDCPAQKEALCPDGLHPNDAGNVVIAKRLQAFLERF